MSSGGAGRPPGSGDGPGDGEGSGGGGRVFHMRDLGAMPAVPVGTRVFVDEDRNVYIGIGNTTVEIAERLGWAQENVWMSEHALRWNQTWHPVLTDPLGIAANVLRQADSVHED